MNWTPRNKKTGVEYDPVDDATKAVMESDPMTKGKYRFSAVPPGFSGNKEALEAGLKVGQGYVSMPKNPKQKPEKEKLTPVGVEPPKEHTEKELPQA